MLQEKKMQGTFLLKQNSESKKRVIINEGSSRSAKTYSIMQMFVLKLLQEQNILITITRKTLPALKATAYRDFLDILYKQDLYSPKNHNKSELTYKIGTNEIEFISVDNFEKVKGRKRDYLFCNEANELSHNDFTQLALRTTKQIWLDYNPSHEDEHWIEEKIKTRDDIEIIHSTYKDNPFLEDEVIREIERLQHTDINLWKIYGLGIRGIAEARIYNHFQLIDCLPEIFREEFYGLDFGFNHPTALMKIREHDDDYYIKEEIYASGLTNTDLIKRMEELKIPKNKFIFCDTAEPARIEELRRAGYNVHPANKFVVDGILTVKSKRIFITKDSVNTLRESKMYSWKTTTDGKVIKDDPVMLNDDAMCGIRYGIHSYLTNAAKQPSIRVF